MERPHNILDRILNWVPGYGGYSVREERRQSDARLRERVAGLLHNCETVLTSKLAAELKSGSAHATDVEHCRKQINSLVAQIRYAPYGVTAFMSRNEIRENELQEIMNHDLAMLELVTKLSERIEELSLHDLQTVLDRIDRAVEARNSFIREFK